ncbi:hypothetical protein IQ06DRAFT_299007 [Phaeosphaeriaceae sp. SRC1lsM3a]|nr:hypothetical protein IQ06DRAFT_299007 [Stagonospora sp. SRC1lsM3a]
MKERDGATGQTVQQYMTLPAYFTQPGEKSFEEARTDDVKNGFVYKTTIPEALLGVPASNNKFGSPVDSRGFGGWGQKAALGLPIPAFGTSVHEANGPTPSLFNGIVSSPRPNPFAASTAPTKPPPNPFANVSLSQHATAAGFGQGPFSSAPGTESGRAVAQLFGSTQPASSSRFSAPSVFGAGAAPQPSTSTPFPATDAQPWVSEDSFAELSPKTKSAIEYAQAPALFGSALSSKPTTSTPFPATDPQPSVSGNSPVQLFGSTNPAPEPAPKPSLFGAGAVVGAMSTMSLKPTALAFSPSAPVDIDAPSTSTSPFTFGNAEVSNLFVEAHKACTGAASSLPKEEVAKKGVEWKKIGEGEKAGDAEASVGEEEKEKEKGGNQASEDLKKGKKESDGGASKEDV